MKKNVDIKRVPRRVKQWSSPNKTIIVLGMHRSGTSMIASVVEALGVHMGEELLPPHETDNKYGYYEDTDFVPLNDSILTAAGGDWIKPPARYKILIEYENFKDRIEKLITKKQKNNTWGWKDPRTALTVELFLPYIDNPHFIYIKRDFASVAKSLKKRNEQYDANYLFHLSEEYNQRIQYLITKNKKIPALELRYEDVIKYPKRTVKKIELFLGYNFSKEREINAIGRIKPEEKHN